eukprot:scaffold910_cov396-Prasinococcus_capsulatus_cf.AAC.3
MGAHWKQCNVLDANTTDPPWTLLSLPECPDHKKFPPPPPPPSPPSPPMMMMISDPHIQGLDGSQYDFHGVAGRAYNILSSELFDFFIISRFETAYTTGLGFDESGNVMPYKAKGTWMANLVISSGEPGHDRGVGTTVVVTASKSFGVDTATSPTEFGFVRVPEVSGTAFPITENGEAIKAAKVVVENKVVLGPCCMPLHLPSSLFVKEGSESRAAPQERASAIEYEDANGRFAIKVWVVPPPREWSVDADDTPVVESLSHLNLEIIYVRAEAGEQIGGLMGISAYGMQPHGMRRQRELGEAPQEASRACVNKCSHVSP